MAIYCPPKYATNFSDVNASLGELKGELTDRQARITLAKFLRHNLGYTVDLLCGIKLKPFQEMTLKAWFVRNFNLCVWGRGCSKTTMAAIFCFLYPIFNPGAKIIISGPTFRTARHIFTEMEKLVESPNGKLLQQIFGHKARRNDLFEWQMRHPNGSVATVSAIPLSGDKVRGFRANVLIIDEFLLMPQDIVDTVLTPFLSVPIDVAERMEIKDKETELIKAGELKEENRMVFDNNVRVIFLSSASYTFEYLYTKYNEWRKEIEKEELTTSKYFISQLGWEAIPKEMLSQEIIEAARDGGVSHSAFQREWGAIFTDDSEGYFSAKKMKDCTIPDGEEPTTRIIGDKEKKYILSIDPSFSNSPASDYFAMSVLELENGSESPTVVHNYAVAGGDLKDHISYLYFLMTNFNIIFIIIDNAGFQFIDSANESELFKTNGIQIDFFDFDSDLIGKDYDDMLRQARMMYSPAKKGGRIAFKQVFTTEFIRNANVHLQTCIDHKKIWFASQTVPNGSAVAVARTHHVDLTLIGHTLDNKEHLYRFIELQDELIINVKKQCALIEVKSTAKGTQSFDLPLHLKKSVSVDRARKDNYTALLLGTWATKCYFDIIKLPKDVRTGMFVPVVIK